MSVFESLDYWFFVPVFFWIGLYFWFYRCSYPLYLKKRMKQGCKWAFVPKSRYNLLLLDILFVVIVSCLSTLPIVWVIFKWTDYSLFYGIVFAPIFILPCVLLCKIAKSKTASLFQSAYFLEYCKVRYFIETKGSAINESDLNNRAIWSFTKKLRNAELHGCLWKYVNAMANTKKIPPDLYAEALYA